MPADQYKFQMAIHDFQSARQKAAVQEILARVTGKSTELLSYEDVAEKLKLHVRTDRGVQHIPLDAIVGSTSAGAWCVIRTSTSKSSTAARSLSISSCVKNRLLYSCKALVFQLIFFGENIPPRVAITMFPIFKTVPFST